MYSTSSVYRYFSRQIHETEMDPALRLYGALLALVAPITAAYWLFSFPAVQIVSSSTSPICWPFWRGCQVARVLSGDSAGLVIVGLGVLGLWNCGAFLSRRDLSLPYWTLLLATLIRCSILILDYRLAANQHYMANWVTGAFLFFPFRRQTIPPLIVLFYFWAGLLKLNQGWLSGDALLGLRPFGMPATWVPIACGYVVLLEIALSWALVSRRRWLFASVFAQILLFHLSSFWVVGFFYPVLMFCVLGIFPLIHLHPREHKQTSSAVAFAAIVMVVFSVLQLVPKYLSNDPAMTGVGRQVALNMFDAPIYCEARLTMNSSGRGEPLRIPFVQARLACDPIIFWQAALAKCDGVLAGDDFRLTQTSWRRGDTEKTTVIDFSDFCSHKPDYHWLSSNEWIHANK